MADRGTPSPGRRARCTDNGQQTADSGRADGGQRTADMWTGGWRTRGSRTAGTGTTDSRTADGRTADGAPGAWRPPLRRPATAGMLGRVIRTPRRSWSPALVLGPSIALLAGCLSARPGPSRDCQVRLPLGRLATRLEGRGPVRSARALDGGALRLRVELSDRAPVAELWLPLRGLRCGGRPLSEQPWDGRASLRADVRLEGGARASPFRPGKLRLALRAPDGGRWHLPHARLERPAGGRLTLRGVVDRRLPIPLGSRLPGRRHAPPDAVGLRFEHGLRAGPPERWAVTLRSLTVALRARPRPPEVLPLPATRPGQRARRGEARLRARWTRASFRVGVNLPQPFFRSPDGQRVPLYGVWLAAPKRWYGRHPDLRDPEVLASLQAALREVAALFGPGAPVRLVLFADLRAGLRFGPDGTPRGVDPRAVESFERLLEAAEAADVVLLPVLLDFTLADGRSREGPDGRWKVGERVDLVLSARKRRALWNVLASFVRRFAGHRHILAWDLVNEPMNAAAVVRPGRLGAWVRFLRQGAERIGRTGAVLTVGHRDPMTAGRFGPLLPVHLAQAHFYPEIDGLPAPFSLRFPPRRAFGALPGGWGELPLRPGRLLEDLRAARAAGHRFALLWSWLGDAPRGDGLAVRPHRREIRDALETLRIVRTGATSRAMRR